MQVEPIVFVMNLPFYVMLANYVGNDGVNIHVNEMVGMIMHTIKWMDIIESIMYIVKFVIN